MSEEEIRFRVLAASAPPPGTVAVFSRQLGGPPFVYTSPVVQLLTIEVYGEGQSVIRTEPVCFGDDEGPAGAWPNYLGMAPSATEGERVFVDIAAACIYGAPLGRSRGPFESRSELLERTMSAKVPWRIQKSIKCWRRGDAKGAERLYAEQNATPEETVN